MPNPGGTNQFQGFPETIPYGDKARQGTLQRLAPLAGKPVAEPRRASQDANRSSTAAAAPEPMPPMPVPSVAAPPPGELYTAIASIDGASPLVRSIFGGVA